MAWQVARRRQGPVPRGILGPQKFQSVCERTIEQLAAATDLLTLLLVSRCLNSFLDSVQLAGGRFKHIPTGNTRDAAGGGARRFGALWDGPGGIDQRPLRRRTLGFG